MNAKSTFSSNAFAKMKSTATILLMAVLIVPLGTGCIHVTSKHTVQPILDAVNKANQHNLVENPEFAETKAPLLPPVEENVARVKQHLSRAGLDKLSAVRKIMDAATNRKPVTLNSHETKILARSILERLDAGAFNGTPKTNLQWHAFAEALKDAKPERKAAILTATNKPDADVFTLLESYYIAYSQGQFTMRDGTVLGKPTAHFGITNGAFGGAIPNDTVDGIVTIFSEAVSDAIFRTPLYFKITTNISFVSTNMPASMVFPGTNLANYFVAVSVKQTNVANDFLLNGKTPTASKFLSCYAVVATDKNGKKSAKGLSEKEVQFIQAVSGLTAKQSQALAGLIFRSFGAGSAGQFVFMHVSVGNNQVLASIVDNLMSSFSYHLTERTLNEAFNEYAGGDEVVEAILNHYQDLLHVVSP